MGVTKASETSIHRVEKAKVAVFNTNIEMQQGETKGTVLLKNAEDLLNYTTGEEDKFEGFIKKMAEAGVTCVVCQGSMSELAVHFFEKYGMMAVKIMSELSVHFFEKYVMMAVKIMSKWELKRI